MIIEKATLDDLEGISLICAKHSKELGFVRRLSLAENIERNSIFIAKENGKIVGFVDYRQRRDEQTTLYYIATLPDYRRKGVGKALIDKLAEESKLLQKESILLKCPEELPSNEFYKKYGFELIRVDPGKLRRINVWRLNLYYENN